MWYMWTATARREGEEACGICGQAQQDGRAGKRVVYVDRHSKTGGRGSMWYICTGTARREGRVKKCDTCGRPQQDGRGG